SHTEFAPYSKAPDGDRGFPALKFVLRSPMAGTTPEEWVARGPNGDYQTGVALVECLSVRDQVLVAEFLQPPAPKDMGKLGQLALVIGGKTYRVPVDKDKLGTSVPLGEGYQVTLKSYTPNI